MSEKKNKKATGGFWGDFKKFITKGNIIDLAVAVVIGGAFGKIVSSLVTCIITPLTGLFLRSGDLASLKWVITPEVVADEASGIAAVPEVALRYGEFLQNIVDFLVIALVVFVILRVIMNVKNSLGRKEIEAAEAKAKADEEKKLADAAAAAAEAERQENIKKQFVADTSAQAAALNEIRDIMLRIEKQK